jgi:AcrR family transcriptional regulator
MSTAEPEESAGASLTRQRRQEITKAHLLDAAERIFVERGFHAASIDDVAAAAGFTKGAVYSNFRNKEDLFIALVDRRWEQQLATVREVMADVENLAPEQRDEAFRRLTVELLRAGRDWQLLYLEFAVYAARNPEARRALDARFLADCEALAPLLEAEFRRVGGASPVSFVELAAVFLAFFNGVALRRVTHPDDDDALVESAITVLDHAIAGFPPSTG